MTNPAQMEALQAPLAAAPAAAPLVRTFIRELAEGDAVEAAFAVRERERRTKKNGEDYMRLIVADRTGSVEAVCWEDFEACFDEVAPGAVVYIEGRFSIHAQFGRKITVKTIRAAREEEYDHEDLVEGPPVSIERLEADFRALIETIQNEQLKALLEKIYAPGSRLWERFRVAPAAKYYHQAFVHGLLDHTLSVAQAVSAAAGAFPGLDRDVAVTGALLHDIGKIEAYAMEGGAIDLTDAGRLQGEIPLGYYRVRRAIEDIPDFPPARAEAVLHIILSHHGQLEHGSPVVPCTREATLVHMIDNLGGRLGSFDRIEKGLQNGERWSGFDRALAGPAFFGTRGLGEAA